MRRTCLTVCVWLCGVAGVLAFGAGVAGAVESFGSEGTGAGEFDEAHGIAVDQESGDVYLVDRNNTRVEKFNKEGGFLFAWGWGVADGTTQALQSCTTTCFAGIQGGGPGQFAIPAGVAVDNDPFSASHGDVYVVDTNNDRVEKFDSKGKFLQAFGGEGIANGQFEFQNQDVSRIAVGSDGTVYVGDLNRVQEFTPEGVYVAQIALAEAGGTTGLVVDASGDLFVISQASSSVREYSPTGTLIRTIDGEGNPRTLALDASGDLFVDDGPDLAAEGQHHILEYDPSGNELASFDSGGEGGSRGIAFGQSIERPYVINKEAVLVVAVLSPGPLIVEGSQSAEPLPTTAKLNATINPENKDTTYRFEYGTNITYGASVPVPDAGIGSGFEDHAVSVQVTGLSVSTTYHFRVVASNSAGTTYGLDQAFTTLPPALIDSESVTNVASKSATLEGEINPLGTDTTFSFEYGTTTAYGSYAPMPDGGVGSGMSDQQVITHIQGLEPGTAYHYRLTATNTLGVAHGEDRTFTTQSAATTGGPTLPDGRMWELVSPPDKQGAGLEATTHEGGVSEAAADGTAITYLANAPTQPEPQGNPSLRSSQILSRRGSNGWVSQDIATPHDATFYSPAGTNPEYRFFSADLSLALVEPFGETPLPPLPAGSEKTVYVRNAQGETYSPLVTSANVASGTKFGGQVSFVSATPDMRYIVLQSNVPLDPHYPTTHGLFEWSQARGPQLVSGIELLGFGESGEVRNAISSDGSRIFGSDSNGSLYMKDMTSSETVRVDVAQGTSEPSGNDALFDFASSDGSKVFFTDTERLTADSTAPGAESQKPDLYVWELTSGSGESLKGKLTDLTVDKHAREVANVRGVVLGASEDGSYVYFVARGVLSTENQQKEAATPGANNLYMDHYDGSGWAPPIFIATLPSDEAEEKEWGAVPRSGALENLTTMTTRVSPNGRYLAFMSDRSLTGYDNRDALSDVPDAEVYIYDSVREVMRCASCNPTGARPAGSQIPDSSVTASLVDTQKNWETRWLAASIPGWYGIELGHARYQPRYLSDSGRLFFNSSDALAPTDTNGTWDVYEYEPVGTPGCAITNVDLSVRSDGCVGLISSGGSAEESAFVDASENGNDVFFLTKSRLTTQDTDTSLDIYDAKVCTTASPCFQVPPVGPPPCATGDSCKPAPSPQPGVFGPAASATFSGVGNVAALTRTSVSGRSLTRAQKLARALKACRKRHGRRRVVCEQGARKRYGKASGVGSGKGVSSRRSGR